MLLRRNQDKLLSSLSMKVDYCPGEISKCTSNSRSFSPCCCYPVMPCTYTHPLFPRVFPSIVCLSEPRCISERKLKLLKFSQKHHSLGKTRTGQLALRHFALQPVLRRFFYEGSWGQNTSQNPKHVPKSKHFPGSTTRPRIQKHFPESKTRPKNQKHILAS